MKGLKQLFAGIAVSAMAAAPAFATPVNGNGLQNGLDAATQDGSFYGAGYVNDENNHYNPDETWTLDAVGQANAVMMFEFAGFANANTMGIYNLANNAITLELFSGAATQGWRTTLSQNGNNYVATYFDNNGLFQGQTFVDFGGADTFGFYLLSAQNNMFYSQSHLNGDWNNDSIDDDHLVAIQGDGTEMMDPDGDGNYGSFTSNNYILAWEDLRFDGADRDHSDMVVMVESFLPVPEPGTIAVLGLGLLGFGLARRKRA